MALARYRCTRCGEIQYVFEGEEARLKGGNCGKITRWCHNFEKMPPNPIVIHTTNTYMSEPQLDSLKTIYELDKQLNIEVREEKEMYAFNEFRKNA